MIRERLMANPVRSVVAIQVLESLLVVLGGVALGRLWPSLPGDSVRGPSQSLVLMLVCLVLLLVLLAAFGWWSLAGFTRRSRWRQLRLYWLPVVLLVVPFAGGIRPIPLSALGLLVVAYLATAIFELQQDETAYRTWLLSQLRQAFHYSHRMPPGRR